MKKSKSTLTKARQLARIWLRKTWSFVIFLIYETFHVIAFLGAIVVLGIITIFQWFKTSAEERFPEPDDYDHDGDF